LEREKLIFKENPNFQPDFEGRDYLLQRQLKPEARVDVIALLEQVGAVPTSMIDVSDGLASELLHLATRSGVGIRVYEDKLPISEQAWKQAGEFKLEPSICAMNGGEDYELLFTIDQKDYDAISAITEISIIGHITDASEGYQMMTKGEQLIGLEAQGWQAFKS
jgi:thiamine-monophosphate kinase